MATPHAMLAIHIWPPLQALVPPAVPLDSCGSDLPQLSSVLDLSIRLKPSGRGYDLGNRVGLLWLVWRQPFRRPIVASVTPFYISAKVFVDCPVALIRHHLLLTCYGVGPLVEVIFNSG